MMKIFKQLSGAAAAAALIATPTLAAAATPAASPAASLSVAKAVRAAAPAGKSSKLAEGSTATIINIGILAALVGVVLVATGGDDDSDSK